ncbi:hypothetical protein, partial [Wolbachia endosymbiont of Mansonella ozzardi]|uniref:hypothetical protein n=1 Tax=Wolbachia endosymbiont of Mansonella ozzardi TaxID=137464 RepID=UPI001CE13A3B
MSEYWNESLDEVIRMAEENDPLYDFLKESDAISIWEENDNVHSKFNDEENLGRQYPEYFHMLINKANKVK